MIKALILHVATEKVYEGRRNLTTVRRLLSRGDWETVERLQAMGEEEIPSAHQLLWTAVAKNPAFGGRMADMGDELCAVMKDAPETYGGGFSQAKRNVEFLESFGLEDNVSQSDFQLSDLKTDPNGVSIYLCLPQMYMNTHYRWLRLFVGLLVAEMENVQTQPACGHRILVLLDEFAGLERMKSIEKAAAFMAGYGLKMFFVLQSLVQLQAVYKDVWENFLTNCSLKLFFSIDDNFTRDYITKQLGDVEVIREVRSAGANSSETQSESDSRSLSRSRDAVGEHGAEHVPRSFSVEKHELVDGEFGHARRKHVVQQLGDDHEQRAMARPVLGSKSPHEQLQLDDGKFMGHVGQRNILAQPGRLGRDVRDHHGRRFAHGR